MRFPKTRFTLRQTMVVIAAFAFGLTICPRDKPYLGLIPPVAMWLASLRNWAVITLTIILFVFCALIETVLDFPVAAWIYIPIAILFSGALWPERPIWQHRKRLVALIAVNALVLALFLIPWSTRKPFLRHLYSIKPGMSVNEVKKIMAGYMEGTGWKNPWTSQEVNINSSLVFRHSNDGQFNSDWGVVTIQDGKVVDVRFDPD
jgi:hypothetical protein